VTIPFVFTGAGDNFTGGPGDDIFNGTYAQGGTGTFLGATDIANGAGGTADTLNLTDGAEAIILADATWTGITNIEKVTFLSTGDGAQTITSGALFNTAFTAGGINLKTTAQAGAVSIDLSAFTGVTTITTKTIGAGAHTITTGSGAATVNATADVAGAQTIKGANLTSVVATVGGAGNQIIGDGIGGGAALVTVTATVSGAGDQTITSTSASAVTVVAVAAAGAQTITTAGGADSITLTTAAGQVTTIVTGGGNDTIIASAGTDSITGGLGADSITGGGAADTFVFGATGSVIGTSMDVITDFNTGGADIVTFGAATTLLGADLTALVAGSGVGSDVQQSAGGMIIFDGADSTSLALKIAAVQADTELDAGGSVAMFIDGANTYLYYAGAAPGNADDQLIQLSGITSLTAISGGATMTIG